MNALVLGLDGGGTKTHLVVAGADGRIAFGAAGGGVNPMDNPHWRDNLEEVLRQPQSLHSSIRFAVLGLPGYAEVSGVTRMVDETVAQLLPVPHRNENDVHVALVGAFLDGPGTLVLAGTGAMAMAQTDDQRVIRVGGWGEVFSDEGSAYWIGQQALRHASQVLDGRSAALPFAAALLNSMGITSEDPHDGLVGWCLTRKHPRSEIAALALFVDRLADAGNPTALSIMNEAASELSAQLQAAQRLSGQTGQPWSAAGGVFESRTILAHLTRTNGPRRPASLAPVGGAIWSALRAARIEPAPTFVETFTAELACAFPSR